MITIGIYIFDLVFKFFLADDTVARILLSSLIMKNVRPISLPPPRTASWRPPNMPFLFRELRGCNQKKLNVSLTILFPRINIGEIDL